MFELMMEEGNVSTSGAVNENDNKNDNKIFYCLMYFNYVNKNV